MQIFMILYILINLIIFFFILNFEKEKNMVCPFSDKIAVAHRRFISPDRPVFSLFRTLQKAVRSSAARAAGAGKIL